VLFESEYNLWCNSDVNNIWGVKIKSGQVYCLKELKTKNSVRKNSKRSLRASNSHEKALQTLFREDNRVSKLYNCSNKPVNASEERLVSECFTVFFCSSVLLHLFCIINTLHVGVDYLIIYLLWRIITATSETILDLVITDSPGYCTSKFTLSPPENCDHNAIVVKFNLFVFSHRA
jgi:hypothetical protein